MAEARFATFDWAGSAAWQDHIRNIFPTPNEHQLLKIRRKWFIQHVDATLPAEHSEPPPAAQNQAHDHSHSHAHPHTHSKLMLIPAFLFALWPLALALGRGMQLGMIAFAAGVVCKYGRPKLTKEYWRTALWDDDLHSVFFCGFYLLFPARAAAHLLVGIAAVIWVSGALATTEVPVSVKTWAKSLDKYHLALLKGHCEVALGVFLIASLFLPRGSILETILYWQILRVKYVISGLLQAVFLIWRTKIDSFIGEKRGLSPIWTKMKRFAAYMVSTDRSQGQCSVM